MGSGCVVAVFLTAIVDGYGQLHVPATFSREDRILSSDGKRTTIPQSSP